MTLENEATKTDIQLVVIDETRYWSDDIKSKVKSIKTVYLFDKSVATHLCTIFPSYYLIPLYYDVNFGDNTENDELREEIDSEFSNEEPKYFDCSYVNKLKCVSVHQDHNQEFEGRDNQPYDEFMTDKEEYFKCNHII